MSLVMCHVSRVTCHVSHVMFLFFLFFFGQSGEAYRWRVCYQRGLPRLVSLLPGWGPGCVGNSLKWGIVTYTQSKTVFPFQTFI